MPGCMRATAYLAACMPRQAWLRAKLSLAACMPRRAWLRAFSGVHIHRKASGPPDPVVPVCKQEL